jgi:hypothetical protein
VSEGYCIAKNVTQAEVRRIAKQIRTGEYTHTSNRGFAKNWTEFLWPPKVYEKASDDDSKEINKKTMSKGKSNRNAGLFKP